MARKKDRPRGDKYAFLHESQAELDFHGRGMLRQEEICRITEVFIEDAVKKGFKRLLIITGKGLHSSDGPVIKPLLSWYLHKLPSVKSAVTARRDRGGEGALEVELR